MSKVALLTCQNLSGYVSDDQLLVQALNSLAIEVEVISWDASVNWKKFDLAVVRTTWDYTEKFQAFFATLEEIHAQCRLMNPLRVLQWNGNKTYLLDLEQRGVKLIPSVLWQSNESIHSLKDKVQSFGQQLLVKPTIGATSRGVEVFPVDKLGDVMKSRPTGTYLIQPFLSEIHQGELSLVFIGDKFSHGVQKIPKLGDFRVQDEFGGTILPYTPETDEIKVAHEVLSRATNQPLLYGRVDLVKVKGELLLMELELIEPALYFRTDRNSSLRMAKAIQTILDEGPR